MGEPGSVSHAIGVCAVSRHRGSDLHSGRLGPRSPPAVVVVNLNWVRERRGDVLGVDGFLRRSTRHGPSLRNQQCMSRRTWKFFEVVSDENRCDVGMGPPSESMVSSNCSRAATSRPVDGSSSRSRRGPRDQCPRNQSPTAFGLREGRPHTVGDTGQSDGLDHGLGALDVLGGRSPAQRQIVGSGDAREHHLPYGPRVLQSVARVDVTDGAAQHRQVGSAHPFAEHPNAAGAGEGDGAAEAEQCALTCPVGAEQRRVFAFVDGQRDASMICLPSRRNVTSSSCRTGLTGNAAPRVPCPRGCPC